MSMQTYLPEDTVIQRALEALMQALGPVDTARFLNLTRQLPTDSVELHRQWQASLQQKAFFDEVFGENGNG